jgi:hypothetical protein
MQSENEKKPYSKPEAKRFPLRPEEAVLGSCKSVSSTGPGAGPSTCLNVVFCQTAGS